VPARFGTCPVEERVRGGQAPFTAVDPPPGGV
jgi:hypothetical protein